MFTPFSATLPGPRPLLTAPDYPHSTGVLQKPGGSLKVQRTQEKPSRMSPSLKQPRFASTAWFRESSASEDQAGGRASAQLRSPRASGPAE